MLGVCHVLPPKHQKELESSTNTMAIDRTNCIRWEYDDVRLQEELKKCVTKLRAYEEKTHYLDGFYPTDPEALKAYQALSSEEKINQFSTRVKTEIIEPILTEFEVMAAPPYIYFPFTDAISSLAKTNKIAYRIAALYFTEFFKVLFCTPAVLWKNASVEMKRDEVANGTATILAVDQLVVDLTHLVSVGTLDAIKAFIEAQSPQFMPNLSVQRKNILLQRTLLRTADKQEISRYLIDRMDLNVDFPACRELHQPEHRSIALYLIRKTYLYFLYLWRADRPETTIIGLYTEELQVNNMRGAIDQGMLEKEPPVNILFLQALFLISLGKYEIPHLLLGLIEKELGGNIKAIQDTRAMLLPKKKNRHQKIEEKKAMQSPINSKYRKPSKEKLDTFKTRLQQSLIHFPKINEKCAHVRKDISKDIFNLEKLHALLSDVLQREVPGVKIAIIILREYIAFFGEKEEVALEVEVIPPPAEIIRTLSSPAKVAKKISTTTTTTTAATTTVVEEKMPIASADEVMAPPLPDTPITTGVTAISSSIMTPPIEEKKSIARFEIPAGPPPSYSSDHEDLVDFINSVRVLNESKQTQRDLQIALNSFK